MSRLLRKPQTTARRHNTLSDSEALRAHAPQNLDQPIDANGRPNPTLRVDPQSAVISLDAINRRDDEQGLANIADGVKRRLLKNARHACVSFIGVNVAGRVASCNSLRIPVGASAPAGSILQVRSDEQGAFTRDALAAPASAVTATAKSGPAADSGAAA